jgi:hypothetical protein
MSTFTTKIYESLKEIILHCNSYEIMKLSNLFFYTVHNSDSTSEFICTKND